MKEECFKQLLKSIDEARKIAKELKEPSRKIVRKWPKTINEFYEAFGTWC